MACTSEPDCEESSITRSRVQNKDAIGRYLTTIILSSVEAINSRNFDMSKDPWTSYAASFRNESYGKLPLLDNIGIDISNPKGMSLITLLEQWKSLAAACAGYRIEVVDTDVCGIDVMEGKAELSMRAVSLGIPEGVVRPSVSIVEFRRMGGKWWCTRMRTLPGLDLGGSLTM